MNKYMDRFDGEQKSCFPICNCGAVYGGEAFLIREGTVNIIVDTGFSFCGEEMVKNVKKQLKDEKLNYILLTHSHYDHAMGSAFLKREYPNAVVIGSHHCKTILEKDSARKAMWDMDIKAASAYGREISENLTSALTVDKAVNDGETFTLGNQTVRAVALPGHTRCCMGYYFVEKDMLVAAETIGVYIGQLDSTPGCLVGCQLSIDSIDKVIALNPGEMLVSHNGMLYGNDVITFLNNSKKSTFDLKEKILTAYKNGCSLEEMINIVAKNCYSAEIEKFYPKHAFITNTVAQINMFIKEYEEQK